jgi:mRNA-degrading endonuclease toxin of MazEF toxin-antitoxin module
VSTFRAGQIVLADWRDALPKEPNKLRPAIVVEDDALFDDDYPNLILVPLSGDPLTAPAELTLAIDPTPQNGCSARCYALSCSVTTASVRRVQPTSSRILPEQLIAIRRQIAEAIGLS